MAAITQLKAAWHATEADDAGPGARGKADTDAAGQARMSEAQVDQMLVERVQKGDKRAFDLLINKYQHRIVSLVSRYVGDQADAMDVAQEAFIKAYRAIDRFRGDSAFYTWLYRIAINTAKNWRNKATNIEMFFSFCHTVGDGVASIRILKIFDYFSVIINCNNMAVGNSLGPHESRHPLDYLTHKGLV